MSVDPTPHLIVPFAQCGDEGWLQATTSLAIKNLDHLLRGMKLVETYTGHANSLSPPHERALTQAWDLKKSDDGLIPWAALEANATPGQAWAFITPCHWAMGREHATLTDPATLGISEDQSRTLMAAMQHYFATEGITLHYLRPACWLARGDVFRSLPTASLDRVLGRNVDRWLPASKAIKLLQNEMQMLLYTHPVNDERAAIGQRSVNSFWVSGSGALDESATAYPKVDMTRGLAQATFANDWPAYAQAWAQLDATDISQLLAQQRDGETVRLTLCGESNSVTFESVRHSIFSRIKGVFTPLSIVYLLKQL